MYGGDGAEGGRSPAFCIRDPFWQAARETSNLAQDGLRIVCASLDNDPEKIGVHMLEMLAKFRNAGIVD